MASLIGINTRTGGINKIPSRVGLLSVLLNMAGAAKGDNVVFMLIAIPFMVMVFPGLFAAMLAGQLFRTGYLSNSDKVIDGGNGRFLMPMLCLRSLSNYLSFLGTVIVSLICFALLCFGIGTAPFSAAFFAVWLIAPGPCSGTIKIIRGFDLLTSGTFKVFDCHLAASLSKKAKPRFHRLLRGCQATQIVENGAVRILTSISQKSIYWLLGSNEIIPQRGLHACLQ